MQKFIIISPLSAISRRTRLFKLSLFVNRNMKFMSITHLAWERIKGEAIEKNMPFSIEKKIILRGGGYGGNKIKFMYFLWIFKVFFVSLFTINKNDTVWALGFESAFPALLASKFKGFRVFFDDADRFSMIFNFPKPMITLLQILEKYTSRNVDIHIIPGIERYDFTSNNFRILKNMPSESEVTKAKDIYKHSSYIRSKLVININGWLGEGRGMQTALDIAKYFKNDIAIVLAGKIDCDAAKELSTLDNVQYLGEISNAEALASYFVSDFVFTYYNPSMKINTFAESNKWGDAIKIGVGVIVNNEVKTAEYLRQANAAISVDYMDTESLIKELQIIMQKDGLLKIKENAKNLSSKFGYFEEELEKILPDETT